MPKFFTIFFGGGKMLIINNIQYDKIWLKSMYDSMIGLCDEEPRRVDGVNCGDFTLD